MGMQKNKKWYRRFYYTIFFLLVNVLAVLILGKREAGFVDAAMTGHAEASMDGVEDVMGNYIHSFQLFAHIMAREIEEHPDPDEILDYLKKIDSRMFEIEGDTFDGLYMYYKGRYLYSWDTPYSEYEDTGYAATSRPWYTDAVKGNGQIVFTPPYMSYANNYILSTISQLQPDGETVFAYDIRMGDIQKLVSSMKAYDGEQMLLFDNNGTIIGSMNEDYLGGNLYTSPKEAESALAASIEASLELTGEQREKMDGQIRSASSFQVFCESFNSGLPRLLEQEGTALRVKLGDTDYYGYLRHGDMYHVILLVPVWSMLKATVQVWLVPFLLLELLLIYGAGRVGKEQKNRELRAAYVELGQMQKRLELALHAAQRAAAVDDLTGLMNFKSFRESVSKCIESMETGQSGILIMLDGDHFKAINDNYGHLAGDEVIKLSAQMIIGRIRTIDLASRLHGDEFSIFVANTNDYSVAARIVEDINHTLSEEAARRNIPPITLSAGAVIAHGGDSYTELAKLADTALYRAKETHNGGFAGAAVS